MKLDTSERLEQVFMFAKRVRDRTKGVALRAFLEDEFLQDAVMYCLGQIGENASKVSDEDQEKFSGLFWNQMIALRHRLFHDYGAIDFTRVYKITQEAIPLLVKELESILKSPTHNSHSPDNGS